jgi:hypothetical protein
MKVLIDNARDWWRLWSIRLNAIGLAIVGWVWFDPVGVLAVWNMMPIAVRGVFPPEILFACGLLFFALSMIARLVKQPKLHKDGQ